MKKYRTLVQVVSVQGDRVEVVCPPWDLHRNVVMRRQDFPEPFASEMAPGKWLLCWGAIGAEDPADLGFERFEPAPEPDPEDGLAPSGSTRCPLIGRHDGFGPPRDIREYDWHTYMGVTCPCGGSGVVTPEQRALHIPIKHRKKPQ